MTERIASVIVALGTCLGMAAASSSTVAETPTRWVLQGDGALLCELDGKDPFPETPVEYVTHGRRVIMRVLLPVDDGGAAYLKGPEVQWPIFKKGVRDRSLVIPGERTRASDLPSILVDGEPHTPRQRKAYRFDGSFQVLYGDEQGIRVTRTLYPSIEARAALQEWEVENVQGGPVAIEVRPVLERLWERQAVDGEPWSIDYVVTAVPLTTLEPGQSLQFTVAYTAHPASDGPLKLNPASERKAYLETVQHSRDHAVLETPEVLIDRTFRLAKLRILLSNIETRGGVLNTTGSMDYHCGFWANDNAEYTSPLLPLLGSPALNEGLNTMYRVWLEDIKEYTLEEKQITGSFESYNLMPYQRGRGDEAMILYGLSMYLLTQGDRALATEMWPLIERCADYLAMNRNEEGVIDSRTDELEGRFPTGTANLSTSALAYGGLGSSADLALALGKPKLAERYRSFAEELGSSIDTHFGDEVEGFETYRYYEGNDHLRGWISLPVVVGLDRRQEATLEALFSEKLWVSSPETNEASLKVVSTNPATHWARQTYYALLAVFKAGKADLGLEKLRTALTMHMLGKGGPFADEDAADLLSPSILYARVITEGLFGIQATGLAGFQCRPSMPADWPEMRLKNLSLQGRSLDFEVRRQGEGIELTVRRQGEVVFAQTGPPGTAFRIELP